ncbi:hypothetical protein SSX86_018358 [Deinandra increscens subsp. villosa]|uniref:Uncharacterized protein n=1 Tax=Deinandra increscens subsp. villosa TaxID=3103831 RepID=A0AAP0CXL9_9ASTR
MRKKKKTLDYYDERLANLEPFQSVVRGALAGAISASLTTSLDVVKTRLMTQIHSEKIATGVSETVKQILMEDLDSTVVAIEDSPGDWRNRRFSSEDLDSTVLAIEDSPG